LTHRPETRFDFDGKEQSPCHLAFARGNAQSLLGSLGRSNARRYSPGQQKKRQP
jgi:hypothetical protein